MSANNLSNRASKAKVRDSHRSLLYLRVWNENCEKAEIKIVEVLNFFSKLYPSEKPLPNPYDVIVDVAISWAATLDDFIVPILTNVFYSREDFDNTLTPAQQYTNLFVDPQTKALSNWAQTLYTRFPFLKVLMQRFLKNSLSNLETCLNRLMDDWNEISKSSKNWNWPDLDKIGPITLEEVKTCASDGHCKGQKVLILKFSHDLRLVYKPFGGDGSKLYHEFVNFINEQNVLQHNVRAMNVVVPLQKVPATSNKYHWAEFLKHHHVQSEDEISSYYYRAGAVTAICEALGFSDGHLENLIAVGSHPVIIDCETFYQPHSYNFSTPMSSIYQTILLQDKPLPFSATSSEWMAAFQHKPMVTATTHSFMVVNERTSFLQILYNASDKTEISESVPLQGDNPRLLKDFQKDFLNGYGDAFKAIYAVGEFQGVILSRWLQQVYSSTTRLVLRPTSFYVILLRLLQQPEAYVSEEAAREILVLALTNRKLEPSGLVMDWEVNDLLEFDVPAFYATVATSTTVLNSKGEVFRWDEKINPQEPWRARFLFHPNENDFHERKKVISQIIQYDPINDVTVDDTSLVECTFSIAEELVTQCFGQRKSYQLHLVRHNSLYSGVGGVLIFMASIASISKSQVLSNSCKELVNSIITERPKKIEFCRGGFSGPGSDAYALVIAGQILSNVDWIKEGIKICVDEISLESISKDTVYDVMDGATGCALVLLSIYNVARDNGIEEHITKKILDLAIECGNHLIKSAVKNDQGQICSWVFNEKHPHVPMTGFSHGNAGMVLAFRRLYDVTKNEEFNNAAISAASSEDKFYDSHVHQWKVTRSLLSKNFFEGQTEETQTGWCYGGLAIALTRLEKGEKGGKILDLPKDLTVEKLAPKYDDSFDPSLCCGVSGQIDLLVSLGEHSLALERAKSMVLRMAKNGSTMFASQERYTFMKGLAGFGYALLRAWKPEKFPSAILFDYLKPNPK